MKLITAENGVKYFRSELIRCKHGFSTRIGGVSAAPHTATLNLAFDRGDSAETVMENLGLLADALGFDARSVVSVPQIHSSKVEQVTRNESGMGYFIPAKLECDGYVTSDKAVTLGVKTADCVPILLAAETETGEVVAVSALHAGWRGTAKNIVAVGIGKLLSLGATPERIFAAIGPAISQERFEVDADCRDELVCSLGESALPYIIQKGAKYFPDLKGIARKLLIDSGLPSHNIDVCEACTYDEEELLYSHRRSNGLRGSMLSVICLQ